MHVEEPRPENSDVLSRRRLLQSAGALAAATGFGAALPGTARASTRQTGGKGRIDTHHHAVPPAMRQWAVERGLLPAQGGPRWAQWDKSEALDTMDANHIAVSVASAPAPSEAFHDRSLAASGARAFNEAYADLVREHPKRFGFFAYLPLLHVDVALKEAAYALDELGADGVLMMVNDGSRYLGHKAFEPLFAELDRRRAVVFTHPAGLPGSENPVAGLQNSSADFMLDTTRAALNLIVSGTLDRHPHLSIILSHAGGFLPYIRGRLERSARMGDAQVPSAAAFSRGLRRFHYDTAMPISPYATPTFLAAVGADRLLYGTDYPQVPANEIRTLTREIERDRALDDRTRAAINRGNALKILPSLARRLAR